MKKFDMLIYAVLIIGGLNWGMVGLFDFDVVAAIYGDMAPLARLSYIVVGLAALYDIIAIKAIWKRWDVHFRKPAHM